MLPFLVDMARLYELFVAEWLRKHLSPDFILKSQERVDIGETNSLQFNIDLILYEANTGAAHCVLDTKYKTHDKPSQEDISQVITYATAKGCREAVLVYPVPLSFPFNERIGNIRVRTLTFSLADDLEPAGHTFLQNLLSEFT